MAVRGNEFCRIEIKGRNTSSNALKRFYKNLDKHNVTVGIHKEEGSKQVGNNGFTLIQNACIQEFGNTQTVEKTRRFRNQIGIYQKKGEAKAVYDGVGYLAKWRMRERIDSKKIKPKNAEMTKEYKGSNTPLYMTGELYFGIESKVH